jgi:hypothetical protein
MGHTACTEPHCVYKGALYHYHCVTIAYSIQYSLMLYSRRQLHLYLSYEKVKVKCTLVQALRLCTGSMAHRGSRGIALPYLEGGEGSALRPGRSLPPEKTQYPLYRRLGVLQGRSGQVRKISLPSGFDPRTVQPVASRYTDYATRPTIRSPYRPARNQSLYRLCYPAHNSIPGSSSP